MMPAPRHELYARPCKAGWTVALLLIDQLGRRTLTEVRRGLSTHDAQAWLDAHRCARAAA